MFKFIKSLFKDVTITNEIIEVKNLELPRPWFVYDCGQDPTFMLWYLQAVNFDNTKETFLIEECETLEECFEKATERIKGI